MLSSAREHPGCEVPAPSSASPGSPGSFLAPNPKDLASSFSCNPEELLYDVAVRCCVGAAPRCDTKLLISCSTLLWASTAGQQLAPSWPACTQDSWLCPDSPPCPGLARAQLCLHIPLVNEAALPRCIHSAEQEHPSRVHTGTCSSSEGLLGSRNITGATTGAGLAQLLSITSSKGTPCLQSLLWESLCGEQLLKASAGPDVVHAGRGHSGSLQRDKQPCQMSPIKLQALYFNNKP